MTQSAGRQYRVVVSDQGSGYAQAATRGHEITLNVKKGSGDAGFNAAETLLAALGFVISPMSTPLGRKCA
jgi:hypothetical protein